jgi:hypothetical protein
MYRRGAGRVVIILSWPAKKKKKKNGIPASVYRKTRAPDCRNGIETHQHIQQLYSTASPVVELYCACSTHQNMCRHISPTKDNEDVDEYAQHQLSFAFSVFAI